MYSEVQQIERNNLKKELELSKEEWVNLKTKIIFLQKENEQIWLHNNESVKEWKEKDKEIKEISLQYQKNLESIDKLNKKCSKLQNSNLILQMNNDDLQVKLERVSHGYKSMHAKTLELESEKKKSSLETIMLKNDIKSKDEIIYNLMTDAYNAKNENNQNFYANAYNELISKLNELFQCPLSLDQIVIPVILPSGITITEGFFDVLKNRNDPYDKNMKITGKIFNRFARDVMDIVKNSKDAVFEEIKKIHKPDPKIEEEKEQISYHQPHENLNSNLDFSFIYNSPSHLNKNKSWDRLKQTSHFNPPFNPFIYPPSHDKKH